MSDRFFLDTNVLVYTFDDSAAEKQRVARRLVAGALQGQGVISSQVAQELLNVVTRKFAVPLTPADATEYFDTVLVPLCEVYPDPALYREALQIQGRWRFSFYDSLVVAAAVRSTCRILYSEDLQHDLRLGELRIVNPFRSVRSQPP